MPDLEIGSLLKSILPGVAALTTKRPESVMRTINVLQAGEQSSEKKRIKAFGIDALKLGKDATPEAIMELAAKHKVNPKTAMDYLNQFNEFRRAKKIGRLDDFKLRSAEREEKQAIDKENLIGRLKDTSLSALDMAGGGYNLPEMRRPEILPDLLGHGMLSGQEFLKQSGFDTPKIPDATNLKTSDFKVINDYVYTADQLQEHSLKNIPIPSKPTGGDEKKDDATIKYVRLFNSHKIMFGWSEIDRLEGEQAISVARAALITARTLGDEELIKVAEAVLKGVVEQTAANQSQQIKPRGKSFIDVLKGFIGSGEQEPKPDPVGIR